MSNALSDWERYLTIERGLKPSSRRLYLRVLEDVRDEVGDPVTLEEEDLRAWLRQRGGKPGTVGNRISALQSFYGFLVKSRVRRDNPSAALERPRGPERHPDPVDDLDDLLPKLDEVDRKANASGASSRRVGETRDMAIFLAETGMRIGEAVKCDWPTPCPPEIAVEGRGHQETTVSVSEKARAAWDRLGGTWPCGARASQRRFEKVDVHPHQFRHWYLINVQGTGQKPAPRPRASPPIAGSIEALASRFSEEDLEAVIAFLHELLEIRRSASAR